MGNMLDSTCCWLMELLNTSSIRFAMPVHPKLRRAKRAPSTDNSLRNLGIAYSDNAFLGSQK